MDQPTLAAVVDDAVDVEYSQFLLQALDSLHGAAAINPPEGDWLIAGGPGGLLFHSAGNDHEPSVRLELWTGAPPPAAGEWDAVAETGFSADSTRLRLWSITAAMGEHELALPAPGTYRARAHVRGQAAIEALGEASFAEGVEQWLVQLWPV